MPLNTEGLRATLKDKIKQALDAPINEKSDSDSVKQDLADAIANAVADGVDVWIKTATVTVQPGIPVTTSAGAGTTSGPGTGTIS
jgi:hypothetical protein